MQNGKVELNTPDNSVPHVLDVGTGEGASVDAGNDSKVVGLAEVVNQTLGTTFKDDASALEGLKETAKFRGKLNKYRPFIDKLEATKGGENQALTFMENITNQNNPEASQQAPQTPSQGTASDPSQFVSREQYEKDMWYSNHKDLNEYAPLIDALKQTNPGKSYDEVAELPAFKSMFDKAKEADLLKAERQPLTSSNRVYTSTPSEERQKDFEIAKKNKDWSGFLRKYKGFDMTAGE